MAALLKLTRPSQMRAFAYTRRYTANVPLVYSKEVQRAKEENKAVVALESTIITHGMPYPKNIETALEVEDIIRERGAIPATIAILSGQLTIGLTKEQLTYLAGVKGVIKASRRDLAAVMADKKDGATTVAGTIIAAELADIPVFVTGGIGGVHRDGEQTMDISADLTELGRSKTLVVCSGVKSILDIARTLEYLETQGVLVCAYGDSLNFPAFYTVRSGHQAPYQTRDAGHAARMLHSSYELQLSSGIVVAVPVPTEYAMDEHTIEAAITKALEKANEQGIRGKEITPFLLSAVSQATAGASLNTNVALIKNNAKVGADIAVEFQKLKNVNNFGSSSAFNIGGSRREGKFSPNSSRSFHTTCEARGERATSQPTFENKDGDVLVIGGANVDRTYRLTEGSVKVQNTFSKVYVQIASKKSECKLQIGVPIYATEGNRVLSTDTIYGQRCKGVRCTAIPEGFAPLLKDNLPQELVQEFYKIDGSTHACKTEQCGGGVSRNIAEALWRMRGGRTKLLTALGDDADGEYLANIAPGLVLDGCVVKEGKTSMYAAIFDAKGECLLGLGDMNIHDQITTQLVDKHLNYLKDAPLVVLDGNVPQTTVDYVLKLCNQYQKPVFFEPTDRRKACKPFHSLQQRQQLAYSSPNITELRAMANFIKPNYVIDCSTQFNEVIELCKIVSKFISVLIVTLGSKGVVTVHRVNDKGVECLNVRMYPAIPLPHVENVSGAGDCFSSGYIHATLLGLDESHCVTIGFEAAKLALLCKQTVPLIFTFKPDLKGTIFDTLRYEIYT